MFSRRTNWNLVPNRLARALAAHRAAGKQLIDLSASNPTDCGLNYPADAILQSLADPRALRYEPDPKGLHSAREAVSRYYAAHCGFFGPADAPAPERIVLTASTSEAYTYVFRLLCNPNDEILLPAPSYPLFEFLGALNDVRLVSYRLFYDHGWNVDFASLRGVISPNTRAVLLVNPNNPTGSLLRASEARQLLDICHTNGIALISDEVFLDYADDPAAARSFALQDEVLAFTLSGLSKISALPQMKVAWIVCSGPVSLVEQALARLEIIADTYLSPNTPVQHAVPRLLSIAPQMQQQLLARVRENLVILDSLLAAAPAAVRLQRSAGWYAIVRLPRTRPDDELAVALLENCSVLIHPGSFFDFADEGYIVLSLILPAPEFAEAARRIIQFAVTIA